MGRERHTHSRARHTAPLSGGISCLLRAARYLCGSSSRASRVALTHAYEHSLCPRELWTRPLARSCLAISVCEFQEVRGRVCSTDLTRERAHNRDATRSAHRLVRLLSRGCGSTVWVFHGDVGENQLESFLKLARAFAETGLRPPARPRGRRRSCCVAAQCRAVASKEERSSTIGCARRVHACARKLVHVCASHVCACVLLVSARVVESETE